MYIYFSFETKLVNGTLYGEMQPFLKYNLNFQTTVANMVMWNLQIKILYILGHTGNDKDRLQHPEQ